MKRHPYATEIMKPAAGVAIHAWLKERPAEAPGRLVLPDYRAMDVAEGTSAEQGGSAVDTGREPRREAS